MKKDGGQVVKIKKITKEEDEGWKRRDGKDEKKTRMKDVIEKLMKKRK